MMFWKIHYVELSLVLHMDIVETSDLLTVNKNIWSFLIHIKSFFSGSRWEQVETLRTLDNFSCTDEYEIGFSFVWIQNGFWDKHMPFVLYHTLTSIIDFTIPYIEQTCFDCWSNLICAPGFATSILRAVVNLICSDKYNDIFPIPLTLLYFALLGCWTISRLVLWWIRT